VFAKNDLKASSPPAEAPRPTTRQGMARLSLERGAVTPAAIDAGFFCLAGAPLAPRFPLCLRGAIAWPRLASGAEKIPARD
jgi:hypothetical protein